MNEYRYNLPCEGSAQDAVEGLCDFLIHQEGLELPEGQYRTAPAYGTATIIYKGRSFDLRITEKKE